MLGGENSKPPWPLAMAAYCSGWMWLTVGDDGSLFRHLVFAGVVEVPDVAVLSCDPERRGCDEVVQPTVSRVLFVAAWQRSGSYIFVASGPVWMMAGVIQCGVVVDGGLSMELSGGAVDGGSGRRERAATARMGARTMAGRPSALPWYKATICSIRHRVRLLP